MSETARLFSRDELDVILVARRRDELEALAAELTEKLARAELPIERDDTLDRDHLAPAGAAPGPVHPAPTFTLSCGGIDQIEHLLMCSISFVNHRLASPRQHSSGLGDARRHVERFRSGVPPRSLRERVRSAFLEERSKMMVARTVAIDGAIRTAASLQVVILGAGLDGRAWRMPELADVTVFEVDHPDSQREKRVRAASLKQAARDVRFVPVDFTRDRLAEALASAGHDPARRTTWVWEGVVMYLARADIEATLRVVEARSAPGSRLVVVYHSPSFTRQMAGLLLAWVGEPFRSSFTAAEMHTLLAGFGFNVVQDDDLPRIAAGLSARLAAEMRLLKEMRIATAEKR